MPDAALFVVADGMGGKTGGAMAAQQVMSTAKHLFEEYSIGDPIPALLTEIVNEAHAIIRISAISSEKEPHSTIVAALVQPHRANWAHVGDSRLYHFRDAELIDRTIDHSYVEQLISEGRLNPAEAYSHRLSNLLTHALGTPRPPSIGFGSADGLIPGESFLLCSDGLWHYFNDAELGIILSTGTARQASERLMQLARERGNNTADNCTLAIVRLEAAEEN